MPLSEVYDDTEILELEDELYLIGADDPTTYRHASNDKEWRSTMQKKMDSIERNGTWELIEPPRITKYLV